jgi:hypothetical protein
MTLRVACGSLNAAICRSAYGAEQKLMIGTRGFRFCPEADLHQGQSESADSDDCQPSLILVECSLSGLEPRRLALQLAPGVIKPHFLMQRKRES